jgi:pyruvate dehydrogenase E1 component beta subunit
MDVPVSENAMAGSPSARRSPACAGDDAHPLEFALLAIDQIVSQAAKWRYMFGGPGLGADGHPHGGRPRLGPGAAALAEPAGVVRAHARPQGDHAEHPARRQGMLISAIEDDDPSCASSTGGCTASTGRCPSRCTRAARPAGGLREGTDLTIAATSYMSLEATKAAEQLAAEASPPRSSTSGRSTPFDESVIVESVRKTAGSS